MLSTFHSVIADTLRFCEERFLHQGVQIIVCEFNVAWATPMRVTEISQVLVNLLNNSLDAVVDLNERWVMIDVQEDDDTFQIIVTDSGNGIPPEIADKMMVPFFTTKALGKGTGLGLSISRGIMESHGGSLAFVPTHPKTRFVATFKKP